jgi:hypothetical protein
MKFAEYLAERQGSPLYRTDDGENAWFLTKYQHVERLGHDDALGLLDGTVVVQEKLDGANFTVAKHPTRGIIMASRNNVISVGGTPSTGFNGAIDYVLNHPGFNDIFSMHPDWVLRGEWLVRHSINYAKEFMGKFYCFDVQDGNGAYIPVETYAPYLNAAQILMVPVLATIDKPTHDQLVEYTKGGGYFGAEQKEGIVVKRYDFVNKYGRVTWGKLVAADFKEANKIHMGAAKHDPIEIKFAALIKDEDILKVIHKLKDEKGETSVRDMAQVIGRVWNDAFVDHLWDFVKKEHVGSFDFQQAKKLVDRKAREVALAHYNGLLQ